MKVIKTLNDISIELDVRVNVFMHLHTYKQLEHINKYYTIIYKEVPSCCKYLMVIFASVKVENREYLLVKRSIKEALLNGYTVLMIKKSSLTEKLIELYKAVEYRIKEDDNFLFIYVQEKK